MDLLAWWNLIFVLPFAVAVVLLLLQASGAISHGDDDSHHHGDFDGGTALAADLDPSAFEKAWTLLGVGRVPLSIVLTTFALLWGLLGWGSNLVLSSLFPPAIFIWISIAIAAFGAAGVTRALSALLAKVMPATESYATLSRDLIGKSGEALFEITPQFGRCRLHDDYGNLQDIACRVGPGEAPLPAGTRVVLVGFDDESGEFRVAANPVDEIEAGATKKRLQ